MYLSISKLLFKMESNGLYIVSIISNILESENIQKSRKDVYQMLLSDKNYPSVLSILHTLKLYGIKCNVYHASYKSLKESKGYKIVHTSNNEGHFYLYDSKMDKVMLNDGNKTCISEQEFIDRWDGVVVIVERANNKRKLFYNNVSLKLCISILLLVSLLFSFIEAKKETTLFILNLCGIFISVLLLLKDYHEYEELPLCHIKKKFNCEKVHKNSPIRHLNNISFALFPLLFFLGVILQNIIVAHQTIFTYTIYAIAIIVSLIMVYLQTFIIRKYCILCLFISFIVFIGAVVIYSTKIDYFCSIKGDILSFLLSFIICFYINEKLKIDRKLNSVMIQLLKFKRDKRIFKLLSSQSEDVEFYSYCMKFGNDNAENIIHTFLQPKCKYCKKVISEMSSLIHSNSNITWLVSINGINNNEHFVRCNELQLKTMQLYKENKEKALDYFLNGNIANSLEIEEDVIKQFKWQLKEIKEHNIASYPMVIFNGKKLPPEYQISDLIYQIQL